MTTSVLLEAVRRRPFLAFQLHISDGTVHTIRHPESLLVGLQEVIVGITDNPVDPSFTRTETVDARHIVRLVPIIPAAQAAGNGPPS